MSYTTNIILSFTILSLFLLNATFASELKTVHFSKGGILPSSSKRTRNLDTSDLDFASLASDVAVAVDFGDISYTKVDDSDDNRPMMILEISSNVTGFNGDNSIESPFGYFDCDPSYCAENNNSVVKYQNSWFTTTGNPININTSISMGEGAWQLKTPALYFKNFSYFYDKYSPKIYGWIGLGTGSGANENFQTENPIFSLLLNSTYKGAGSLMFGFNSSIADLDNPLSVVNSDANWGMQMTSLSFGSTVFSNTTNPIPVIFDLMITGIYMPKQIFNDLSKQMSTYNMTCFNGGCECFNITGLPSLVFGMAGGQNLSLSIDMLMETVVPIDDGENTTFYETMEIRYTSSHEIFQNTIVLGWDVLANFYTLFQQTNGVNSISFYEINSATPPSPNSNSPSSYKLIIIIGGSLAFIVICVCIGVFIVKKNKAEKSKKIQEKILIGTELNNSVYTEISEPQERYCML